jgi:hypothetical protein
MKKQSKGFFLTRLYNQKSIREEKKKHTHAVAKTQDPNPNPNAFFGFVDGSLRINPSRWEEGGLSCAAVCVVGKILGISHVKFG